ncbi:glycosyltransferase [Spirochaetota bacterium]
MNFKVLAVFTVDNDSPILEKCLDMAGEISDIDLLVVDDGSNDDTYSIIKEYPSVKYVKHDRNLGYGASLMTGFQFANDHDYDIIILLDIEGDNYKADVEQIIENINYGYDIVNLSRILENYEYTTIPEIYVKTTQKLSDAIKDASALDLTDPLSGTLGIRCNAVKHMEFTEFDYGIMIQLWIQAAFFNFAVIEIPGGAQKSFGIELDFYEDPLGYLFSVMETEKLLYDKKTIN